MMMLVPPPNDVVAMVMMRWRWCFSDEVSMVTFEMTTTPVSRLRPSPNRQSERCTWWILSYEMIVIVPMEKLAVVGVLLDDDHDDVMTMVRWGGVIPRRPLLQLPPSIVGSRRSCAHLLRAADYLDCTPCCHDCLHRRRHHHCLSRNRSDPC